MLNATVLAAAVMLWGAWLLAGSGPTGGVELQVHPVAHFAAAYGFCLLAFAACPRTRRGDLGRLTVLTGALLCMVRAAAWREDMVSAIVGEALGAGAAVLPSALERVRSALRADPSAPVSMRRKGDRRAAGRRRSGPVFAASSLPQG